MKERSADERQIMTGLDIKSNIYMTQDFPGLWEQSSQQFERVKIKAFPFKMWSVIPDKFEFASILLHWSYEDNS